MWFALGILVGTIISWWTFAFLMIAPPVHAAADFTSEDTLIILGQLSDPLTSCVVAAETGRTYRPDIVSAGNVYYGIAQMERGGAKWDDFYAMTDETALFLGVPEMYALAPRNWANPYQVAPWLKWHLHYGNTNFAQWPPARYC